MIRIEEIISNALAGIEETEVAILARELIKTREELALAHREKGEAEGRAALADRRVAASHTRWVIDVFAELSRARAKFPKPDLLLTAFTEEAGELVKAILDNYNGKPSDIYGEAIQAMAMVVRLIEEGDPVHRMNPIVEAPETFPGQREHIAFLGALKYELENPTADQKPTSFDINRDYFEHYANVFSKDNERMAHGVGFMNGAAWHRERYAIPADRVPGEGDSKTDAHAVVVLERLLHDLVMAAWDFGADAGIAWDPDADPTKRGIVPYEPEEGLARARAHFAEHGSRSPNSAFSRALQAIRKCLAEAPAVAVPEATEIEALSEPPVIVEDFADNGAHSQWRLVCRTTGKTLWEEASDSIPANLGPGEGIVAVVISDMENIRHLTEKPPRTGMLFGADVRLGACHRIACRALSALSALSANQGGADHD